MTTAGVHLWGEEIGAVSWQPEREVGVFQYAPGFAGGGVEVAPLNMPLRRRPYTFSDLSRTSFRGLPGLFADSLPDRFGNALIDAWLARQNRPSASFNPVERLCYTGTRGIGALEFQPALKDAPTSAHTLEIERLVELANVILKKHDGVGGRLHGGDDDAGTMEDILRVGTSAGGARAKAVLLWNENTGEFRSGQTRAQPADTGFRHWLLKFDGVADSIGKAVAESLGYGRIEYAYALMAVDAGITMMPCRLHEEGGRAHFMTKRFDRADNGAKLHYQSLCALMHLDFNLAGAHSYEQAMLAIKQLRAPAADLEQQLRRAAFNLIARNQDDHVKNIGFLMKPRGQWRLSPAFDLAYNYNPDGQWTSRHQMSVNGKFDDFVRADLIALAHHGGIKPGKADAIVDQVAAVIAEWRHYADQAQVAPAHAKRIFSNLRLKALR